MEKEEVDLINRMLYNMIIERTYYDQIKLTKEEKTALKKLLLEK